MFVKVKEKLKTQNIPSYQTKNMLICCHRSFPSLPTLCHQNLSC